MNIQKLIYRNYLKSSLIPIFVIEAALLFLYFGINFYISDKNRTTLLDEATKNIKEIASREVTAINNQLVEVKDLAVIMQRNHESFFAHTDACFLPNPRPQFTVHANGAFYKTVDNGGSSLYYASTTKIGEKERRKALCSEMLDPLLQSIVEVSPIVTQAYLNTWDDMNRLYPFMPDAPAQYGPAIHMEDYNFYYDADSSHDPGRKAVWTTAYLDPAGQGWMVSVIVPVYRGDFLEGVSGLDVTINKFVENILDLQFPWGAGTFMVDRGGTILAMQSGIERIFKLKELGGHVYSENIKETIEKPEEFNLLKNPEKGLQSRFREFFSSGERVATFVIDGVEYLFSQEIVGETGWRMMTLIETSKVFAPITNLKTLSDRIGLAAVLIMVLFYALFFCYLLLSSRKLTTVIATPITRLSDLTRDLGRQLKAEPLELSGIREVDILTENFNIMGRELNAAMNEAQAARREADSVISNFLDSLLVVDRDLRISRVNRETCLLLGVDKDALLGHSAAIIFEEPQEMVASCFLFPFREETREKDELRNVELTFVAADGAKLPVSINLARLTNDAGETVGVVAGAKDVSQLKRALSLAEQQKLFVQNIIDTIPGGLLVIDRSFHLTRSNDTYQRLVADWSLKYGFEDGRLEDLILSGLAQEPAELQHGEILLPGSVEELIVEYHASGHSKEMEDDSRVIYIHDVTLRHKIQAVRKLQATVLEQTSEGVMVTDTDGIIHYCNLAAQTMSGFSRDEMLGEKTSLFYSGLHDESFYRQLWETIRRGEVWSGTTTNRRRDRSYFETEMTISPVRSTGGEVTHYVSLWRDVSQVRQLQQQLLQVQKLEAIGQLAAGIAHEINTPIQYVMSNVVFFGEAFADLSPLLDELLRTLENPELMTNPEWQQSVGRLVEESGLDFICEEVPEGLKDALDGVKHVARIVEAFKEFSHPGMENRSSADLNRLIDNALVVTQNELKYVAEVETRFAPDLPTLLCDPGSISQVMLNLLVNAADAIREKFGSNGGGHVVISTSVVDSMIELRVVDDGVGIAAEFLDRIFDPFFTTKDFGKGSGQGLSIVYDIIVNKHKGSVTCESRPGIGTTMIIRFPLS